MRYDLENSRVRWLIVGALALGVSAVWLTMASSISPTAESALARSFDPRQPARERDDVQVAIEDPKREEIVGFFRGRVVHLGGAPAGDAEVHLYEGNVAQPSHLLGRTRVDSDGRFKFAVQGGHDLWLLAEAPGYVCESVRAALDSPAELVLRPTARQLVVSGRVTDVSMRGLSGAQLVVMCEASGGFVQLRARSTTGADGRFDFAVSAPIDATELAVQARHDGFVPSWAKRALSADGGKVDVGLLTLDRGQGPFSGLVVNSETLAPISAATIVSLSDETLREGPKVTSEHDGSFRFERLAGATLSGLVARAPGYGAVVLDREALRATQAGPYDFVVALAPGGHLRGRVLDQRGAPRPKAAVLYWRSLPLDPFPGASTLVSASAVTAEDGRFEFQDVPCGVVLTLAIRSTWAATRSSACLDIRQIVVEPGEASEVDLQLDEGAGFRGRTALLSGPRAPAVWLEFRDLHGSLFARVETTAGVEFVVPAARVGVFDVRARFGLGEGHRLRRVSLPSADGDIGVFDLAEAYVEHRARQPK